MTKITRTSLIALMFSTLSFAGIYPPQEGDLTAEIPFEFVLQGKTLPAGNYIIRAEESGQVEICEDGVYCETVQARVQRGQEAVGRIEFRHDGMAQHLSLLEAPTGIRHRMPAEPEPMIPLSGDADESVTSVAVRPLRILTHPGTGLAPTWH